MMIEWLHSQQAETIGWTLLHSLWELSAIAAAIAGMLLMLRRRSANLRYAVACLGMALMVIATAATYCHLLPATQVHMATPPSLTNTSPSALPDDPPPTLYLDRPVFIEHPIATAKAPLPLRLKEWIKPALPYAAAFYLIGALLLTLRMLAGYGRMQLLTRSALAAGGATQSMLAELTLRLGVTRSIRLLESAAVEVPTMLGLLKPVILLPASALTGLSPDQLLALLAHEIAHIRRHDYAANLFQSVIETLLFYHPATWWLSARIRQERENCCDDLAVSITGDRLEYARALASMEALRTAPTFVPPHLALTARSGVLLPRIRRLLGVPSHRRTLLPAAAFLLLLLLGGIVYLLATATNPPAPQTAPVAATPGAAPGSARQATLDGMLIIIPTKLLDDAGIHWDQNLAAQVKEGAAADAPLRSVQLKTTSDKSALAQLQAKTKGDKRVEMKPLPLATLLEGQTTRISAGDQIKYIKGLRHPQLGATQPSTPEMATFDTGLKLDLLSTFVPQATNLDIHSSYVRLDGMDTFETSATPGEPPSSIVQVPKTSTAEFTASAALADGGTLMIAGPTFKGEREVESSVPYLSQLPGVGGMFTNRSFVSEEMTLVYVLRSVPGMPSDAATTQSATAAQNLPPAATQHAPEWAGDPIGIEARILLVPANFFDDFRIGWSIQMPAAERGAAGDATAGKQRANATIIDNWTLSLLLTASQADKKYTTVSFPRLHAQSGKYCEMQLREGEIRGAAATSIDLHKTIGIEPTISKDRRYVVMNIGPFAQGDSLSAEKRRSPTTMVALPDGGTLLIDGGDVPEPMTDAFATSPANAKPRRMLILIRPSIGATEQSRPAAAVTIPESGTLPAGGQNTVSPNGPKLPILAKFVVAAVDESALPENLRALKENETATVPLEKNATDTLKDLLAHGKVELLSRPYLMLNDKEEGSIFTGQEGPYVGGGQVRDFPTGYHQKDPADPASEWIAEEAEEAALTRSIKMDVTASMGPKPDMRLKLDLHIMRIIKVERSPAPNVPAEKHLEIFKPIFEDTGITTSLTTESGKSVMIVGPLYTGEPVVTSAAADPAKIDPTRRRLVLIVTPRLPVDTSLQPPTTQGAGDRELNDERQRQVASLVADAQIFYESTLFKGAADLLHQALVIDPNNERAKLFLRLVEDKIKMEQNGVHTPGEDRLIPYADLFVYPDNWLEVTRKGILGDNNQQASPANRLANERLELPLKELVVDKQSLEKVINLLRDNTNTNIFVNWKALAAAGIDRNKIVSLNLRAIPLGKALTTLLAEAGSAKIQLGYVMDEGIITISTKEDLDAGQNQSIRVYDIRDLLIVPADRSSPFFNAGDPPKKDENAKDDAANAQAQLLKNIVDTIKSTIKPDSWRDNGGTIGSIRELNGQLIINQTTDNQRDILKLLTQLRDTRSSLQIALEAKLVVVDDDILASLPPSQTQPAPGAAATQPAGKIIQLDDKQLDALLKKIEASPTSSTVIAPRVNLFNGQRGFMAVTNQQNYVAGCKAKPDKDGKLVPDMDIQMLISGTTLDIEATVSKDRSQVVMNLKPTIRRLVRMETLPAPGTPASPEFFIQKPVFEEASMSVSCALPSGKAAVIIGVEVPGDILDKTSDADPKNPTVTNKKRSLILIVRPTIVIHREIENDLFGPGYDDTAGKPVQEFKQPTGLPGNPSSQPK